MKRKLGTSVRTTVKVSQRITLVKYVAAGTLVFTLLGGAVFLYLNFGSSENADAGNNGETSASKSKSENLFDLSHLSLEEMDMLLNRDFERDTVRKEYTSVKWNLNSSLSHLTLEVSNTSREYSLELFDRNGSRVLYFANLTSDKVFVDKLELRPNHEYNYVVRNSAGEMYAGNLKF